MLISELIALFTKQKTSYIKRFFTNPFKEEMISRVILVKYMEMHTMSVLEVFYPLELPLAII
jgi:hypothetical protein